MDGRPTRRSGLGVGVLAALTFGAGAPFAQRLVRHADPQLLAGLLYAGAFGALLFAGSSRRRDEPPVRRSDLPALAALVVLGGVAAPVLLLIGLERVSGLTGSLLLNVEAPLTAVLAVVAFGEHLGRRAAAATVVIALGASILGAASGSGSATLLGAVAVVLACGCWALDNNLTQRLTVRDPVTIVRIKALGAAVTNLAIAALRGASVPAASVVLGALALGAVSYGLSILLDAYALRALGAAREAAVFATAPFAGALMALALGDTLDAPQVAGFGVMLVGSALLLRSRHEHVHEHVPLTHEHRHVHDSHHEHDHPPGTDTSEPHSHEHTHAHLVHAHPHVSDLHHRHAHRRRRTR